jgi:hypothetical protein
MITLEELNLTEEELDSVLTGIYEKIDDPEKDYYQKFIREDATVDQKLALFEQSKSKFYKLIETMAYNCRQANTSEKTFDRQVGAVECGTLEAARMIGAAHLYQEADEEFMDEWLQKLEHRSSRLEHYIEKGSVLTEGGWKTLFGFLLIGPIYWAAYRGIRAAVSEKSRRCGALGMGRTRDVCLWKVRREEALKYADLIKKNLGNCKNAGNPQKCQSKGEAKIKTYQAKAAKLQAKIEQYRQKSPKKAGKAEAGEAKAADKSGKWA